MKLNSSFKLYQNCIPIKGKNRSIIYDLTRNDYKFIPNILYHILTKENDKTISELIDKYDEKDIIKEYFIFLLENEYIFFGKNKEFENFPDLSLEYNSPYIISNVILELSKESNFNYKKLFKDLDLLGNIDLQIKIVFDIDLFDLDNILSYTFDKRIKYIEIYLPYIVSIEHKEVLEFLKKHLRISKIVFYNTPELIKKTEENRLANVLYSNRNLAMDDGCGQICNESFIVEMGFFTESVNYNNCLNQKLSIDKEGEIKNCLHFESSYGNILSDDIEQIVKTNKFQKLWHIKKDDIVTCKVCEFRYMCSDCRAYIEDESNAYSKPKYCLYKP